MSLKRNAPKRANANDTGPDYKRHLLEKLKFKEMFTQIILRINPRTLFFMIGHLDTLKRLNRELRPKNKE